MQFATLGKTGLRVSRLGFGCMRLPMKEERVDRDLTLPLLRRAVDLGVNYFDTAIGYNNQDSERVLGEATEGIRSKVILSTKNSHYNKKDERTWWRHLENSLERLRTSWIDVYNFHGLNWQAFVEHVDGRDGQIQWMLRAKEQGMIRHIAFSFHDTAENLKKLASTGYFEAVILQYNLLDRSNEPAFEPVTKKYGLGIAVMGPVGGGRLGAQSEELRRIVPGARSVPEVALRFVLANPYVTAALSGMSTMEQLEENAAIASRRTPLAPREKRRVAVILKRFKKLADLYCTGCNYCMPCPTGINIPANFSALNYARVYGLKQLARNSYARPTGARGCYCIACGRCLPKCPQKIDIIGQLRETVRVLDDAYGSLVAQVVPTGIRMFRSAKGRWSATLRAKLTLHNLSDERVHAKATFGGSDATKVQPASAAATLEGFGWKSIPMQIGCKSHGQGDVVDLGAAVEGAQKVVLTGGAFHVAFAPSARASVPRAMRKALPVSLKGSDAKHAAVCRFVHDDEALRLAADVADDLRRPSAPDRPVHATDRITLLLDARPPARFGRPSFDKQVLQLHLLAPGKGDAPLVQIGRPRGADPKQITCKAERTPRGYHVEAAIPWKLLGRDPAARSPGMHLGLDFTLVSYDASGNPAVEMSWSAGKGSARPELCGHLFLTA